jgi:viroplasmin and RNaseH domain-containing protein
MDGYEAEDFLSFQSKEIAKEFLDNFKDLIEQAKPLMS